MNVQIVKIHPDAQIPKYQSDAAAGMDLHARIDDVITMRPLERILVPTGIAIALPNGYEAQVRARSGLALKHGIGLVNGIGTIDADYRGEIGVLLVNMSNDVFKVEPNMRVAQLVVSRHEHITWDEKETLTQTKRASNGFGSTGSAKN